MRRVLALMCVILMTAGLIVIAGCGSSGVNQMQKSIAEGTQSTFLDEAGNIVAFTQFGTFKMVIDEQLIEGNYKIIAGEDENTIEMFFDSGEFEIWNIVITEDEVTGVVDEEGTQYIQADLVEAREVR